MMESKVAEAMSKKETLKARALSAETTKQLNESIVSMVRFGASATTALLRAHTLCLSATRARRSLTVRNPIHD